MKVCCIGINSLFYLYSLLFNICNIHILSYWTGYGMDRKLLKVLFETGHTHKPFFVTLQAKRQVNGIKRDNTEIVVHNSK